MMSSDQVTNQFSYQPQVQPQIVYSLQPVSVVPSSSGCASCSASFLLGVLVGGILALLDTFIVWGMLARMDHPDHIRTNDAPAPLSHSVEFEYALHTFRHFAYIILITNAVEDIVVIIALLLKRGIDCSPSQFRAGDDSILFACTSSIVAAIAITGVYVILILQFSPFWYLIIFLIPVHVFIHIQTVRFLDFTCQRIVLAKGESTKVVFYLFQFTLPFIIRTACYIIAFASFFRVWNENQDHMRIWSTENFCNVENDGGRYYCSYEYFTYHTKGLISLIALSVLAFVATIMSLLTIKARNERDALRYNKKENQQQVILSNTNM